MRDAALAILKYQAIIALLCQRRMRPPKRIYRWLPSPMLSYLSNQAFLRTAFHRRMQRRRLLGVTTGVLLCALASLIVGTIILGRQVEAAREAIAERAELNSRIWRYRLINKSFERWRGTTRQHVIGKTLEEVTGEYEHRRSLPWIQRALNGETVAQRAQRLVRPTDVVARLGGDEFAIVLAGVQSHEAAQRVADQVIAATREPIDVGGQKVSIGASIGIAFNADQDGGRQALVARADAMVYRAKQAGRGRVSIQVAS